MNPRLYFTLLYRQVLRVRAVLSDRETVLLIIICQQPRHEWRTEELTAEFAKVYGMTRNVGFYWSPVVKRLHKHGLVKFTPGVPYNPSRTRATVKGMKLLGFHSDLCAEACPV